MFNKEYTMQIFIMRHGEASPQNFSSINGDSLRPLTNKGCTEAESTGQWLVKRNVSAFDIFVSPYLRAQQTCQHVVKALSSEAQQDYIQLETIDFITPEGDAQQVHDFIDGAIAASVNDDKAILFVSHMPFVSYLVAELTKSQNTPIFATGAIAYIDYDVQQMHGELCEIYTPSVEV